MPFTPAHAAAVLPLNRRPLVLGALVAGSLAPDLPYYFSMGSQPVRAGLTHTWAGTLVVDVPLGLVLLLLARVLARPLAALAPDALRARLGRVVPPASIELAVRPVLAVLLSLWIGALTHLGWDHFTHRYGIVVRHVALLRAEVAPGAAPLHVYEVLQQVSGVFGLTVLFFVLRRWWRRTPAAEPPVAPVPSWVHPTLAAVTTAVVGTLVVLAAATTPARFRGLDVVRATATRVVEATVAGVGLVVLVFALAWWLVHWRTGPHQHHPPGGDHAQTDTERA